MPISIESSVFNPYFFPPLSGGRYYSSSIGSTTTTLVVTSGSLYGTPIFIPTSTTLTAIGVEVTAFATGNVRLGIYNDNTGVPGTLLEDSGTVSTGTSNSFKSVATSRVLSPGWYWLACVFDATPTVRALAQANALPLTGFTSGVDTTIHAGYSATFTYAALPTPFTTGALMTGNVPRIMIQL